MLAPLTAIDPATIGAMIEDTINAYRLSLAQLPGAAPHMTAESTWIECEFAGLPLHIVVQARFSPHTVERGIEEILDHCRRRSLPLAWHVGPSSQPASLGRSLLAHGLTHDEDEPGMAIKVAGMREERLPEGLTIETVRDEDALEEWIAVWLFPVPQEIRHRYFLVLRQRGLGEQRPWRYYLGWLDGLPVVTSELFVGHGVAAVHRVVTLPEVRRRGIGSAMTRHVLREARDWGYQVGVLTASPFGIGSYRRIGFQEYCRFSSYEWTPDHSATGGEGAREAMNRSSAF